MTQPGPGAPPSPSPNPPPPGASSTPPLPGTPGPGLPPPPTFDAAAWDPSKLSPEHLQVVTGAQWKGLGDALESYANMRRMVGKEGENLVRLPTDPSDKASWQKVWSRMGWPEKVDGYDFKGIDIEQGAPISLNDYAAWAHEAGLTSGQARAIAQAFVERSNALADEQETQVLARRETGYQKLKAEWGANWDRNFAAAQRASEAFGLKEPQIEALVEAWGYDAALNHLYTLGARLLEHSAPRGGELPPGGFGITADSAKQRLGQRMADKDFLARLEKNEPTAKQEYQLLHDLIHGTGRPG